MKLLYTPLFLFVSVLLNAQTVLEVHLTDVNKKPVGLATIQYDGLTFRTDESGFFRIGNYRSGSGINIHRFGFADTSIMFITPRVDYDTLRQIVTLRLRPILLPEVTVQSKQTEEINPAGAHFVLGYELRGEWLIELLDGHLLVINESKNIQSRIQVSRRANDIVKDPYGRLYLRIEKGAFQIAQENPLKVNSDTADVAKLDWNLRYCDAVADNSHFIRRYKDDNQTTAYFAVSNANNKKVRMLKEISDAERKSAVLSFANEARGFNQYVAGLELSQVTATSSSELALVRKARRMSDMVEMSYVLPSYSPLKLVNDSVYLFAHDIDSLFVYDLKWNQVRSKRIAYHHLKMWGKEIIVNEERTKVYARLLENSVTLLAEIDLLTGTLLPPFYKIENRFPVKIKIRGKKVYYMAKQKRGSGNTVYSQTLE